MSKRKSSEDGSPAASVLFSLLGGSERGDDAASLRRSLHAVRKGRNGKRLRISVVVALVLCTLVLFVGARKTYRAVFGQEQVAVDVGQMESQVKVQTNQPMLRERPGTKQQEQDEPMEEEMEQENEIQQGEEEIFEQDEEATEEKADEMEEMENDDLRGMVDETETPIVSSRALVPKAQLSPPVKKTFAYMKTCRSQCKALIRAGYRMVPGLTAPMYPEFLMFHYTQLKTYSKYKSSILNQVGYGSSCIGGGKGKQLECKVALAEQHGCTYDSIGLAPPQWNIQLKSSCEDFFRVASLEENAKQIWIVKPGGSFHGSGIKLYEGVAPIKQKYPCQIPLSDGLIVQKYVDRPSLMKGHKFDFRSYMLIASTDPFIVFYHDGFVRRSEHPYSTAKSGLGDKKAHITNAREQSSQNHFYSFADLGRMLSEDYNFPDDYLDTYIRPQARRATLFLMQAALSKFQAYRNRGPRYQVFALDWMLDEDGKMGLLEANGNPQQTDYPGLDFAPGIWVSMADLVHKIQVEPESLPSTFGVRHGFRHEGWSMVYNELELAAEGRAYNPCKMGEYIEKKDPLFGFRA